MTDLVLVRPGASRRAEAHWSKALPLGLGYLAASAQTHGITVAVVDGKISNHTSIQQTVAEIQALHPKIVGISALTIEYPRAREIARRLKSSDAAPVTVLGGVHANALPRETLLESPEFDYLIAGEAETSIVEVVRGIGNDAELNQIAGLHTRNINGSVRCCAVPRFDHDISTLPFPAWDLFPQLNVYPLMAERGCPYSCVFCSNNMAQRVRSRPPAHVLEELEWLYRKFAPERIYFEDETFGLHRERTAELLHRIAAFNKGRGLRFKAQTRIDRISVPLVRLMKAAGFDYLEIGVESGSQEVLDNAKKGIHSKAIEEAVRVVKEAGIKTWLNFIIGLPGESRETVRESIELAVRLNPERLSVAIIVAYPGTEIYSWALNGKNSYHLLSSDWGQFDKYLSASVELDNLSFATMRRLQLQMYTETYVRNLRVFDLMRLIWNNRAFVKPIFNSLVPRL